MAGITYHPSGESNVSSSECNAANSLILANLVIANLNGQTIPPLNSAKQAKTSTVYQYRKNLLHNGSKWYTPDYTKAFYLDITATSISALADFEINDCKMMQMTATTWRLICDNSATREVNRAKVFKTLFDDYVGTARVKTTYITGLSAIKSPDAIDTGKRVYYMSIDAYASDTYTFTPSNTTTNSNVQAWSYVANGSSGTCPRDALEFTIGATVVNSACSTGGGAATDETQADTSAERANNPATLGFNTDVGSGNSIGHAFFTCTDGGSFAAAGGPSVANIDFYTTHGVPLFTLAAGADELDVLLTSASLATITTAITTACCYAYCTGSVTAWTTKFSLNDGTNYTSDAQAAVQETAYTGTSLRVKIEFTRASNASVDYVEDFGVIYG